EPLRWRRRRQRRVGCVGRDATHDRGHPRAIRADEGEEAQRLGQLDEEQDRKHERQQAADDEHRSPTPNGHQHAADCGRNERAAPAMPTKIADTNIACRRFGAYSEARETAFGIAPPSPSPVKKRSRTSSFSEVARAVSSDMRPKTTTEMTMADLRPQRSAIGP